MAPGPPQKSPCRSGSRVPLEMIPTRRAAMVWNGVSRGVQGVRKWAADEGPRFCAADNFKSRHCNGVFGEQDYHDGQEYWINQKHNFSLIIWSNEPTIMFLIFFSFKGLKTIHSATPNRSTDPAPWTQATTTCCIRQDLMPRVHFLLSTLWWDSFMSTVVPAKQDQNSKFRTCWFGRLSKQKKTMNIDETTLKFRLMLSYRGV